MRPPATKSASDCPSLGTRALNAPPPPPAAVWRRLEAENPEFFEAYNSELEATVSGRARSGAAPPLPLLLLLLLLLLLPLLLLLAAALAGLPVS